MVQVPAPSACEAHCTLLVCASVSSDRPRPCARGGGVGSDACGVVDWTPIRRRILSFWGTLQGTASPIPLSLFLGVGAPSLSLAGFMFAVARRGSLFVVASAACVLASLALIVILHSMFHPPSRVLWLSKRCAYAAEPCATPAVPPR
jgi:hypothetical protein